MDWPHNLSWAVSDPVDNGVNIFMWMHNYNYLIILRVSLYSCYALVVSSVVVVYTGVVVICIFVVIVSVGSNSMKHGWVVTPWPHLTRLSYLSYVKARLSSEEMHTCVFITTVVWIIKDYEVLLKCLKTPTTWSRGYKLHLPTTKAGLKLSNPPFSTSSLNDLLPMTYNQSTVQTHPVRPSTFLPDDL